jgi:anti-sigma B factor antagonist
MAMDIRIKEIEDITVVTLIGEINGRNAPDIQEQLLPLAQPGCRLLLDMSDVSYMSSAGLRILLMLYREIDSQHGCIVLSNLQEFIEDMMSVTGFLDFFIAYSNQTEALAALRDCDPSR